MRRRKFKPSYSLDDARSLISQNKFLLRSRARKFVGEHYIAMSDREVALGVFQAMGVEHFVKSEELDNKPGTYVDIYSGMQYDEIEWYAKFFISDGEVEQVEVWSLNWDGTVH